MYGLSTITTEAGEDLVNWCETLNLQLVNTFCPIKKSEAWFYHSHSRWYELDGFIMRRSQRHKNVKKIKVTQEMVLSDLKPVFIILNGTKKPKRRIKLKRQSNTNYEKLKDRQTLERFQSRTNELRAQLANEPSWNELEKVLNQAAKETCGVKKRNAANPWTVGHEDELKNIMTP